MAFSPPPFLARASKSCAAATGCLLSLSARRSIPSLSLILKLATLRDRKIVVHCLENLLLGRSFREKPVPAAEEQNHSNHGQGHGAQQWMVFHR